MGKDKDKGLLVDGLGADPWLGSRFLEQVLVP